MLYNIVKADGLGSGNRNRPKAYRKQGLKGLTSKYFKNYHNG